MGGGTWAVNFRPNTLVHGGAVQQPLFMAEAGHDALPMAVGEARSPRPPGTAPGPGEANLFLGVRPRQGLRGPWPGRWSRCTHVAPMADENQCCPVGQARRPPWALARAKWSGQPGPQCPWSSHERARTRWTLPGGRPREGLHVHLVWGGGGHLCSSAGSVQLLWNPTGVAVLFLRSRRGQRGWPGWFVRTRSIPFPHVSKPCMVLRAKWYSKSRYNSPQHACTVPLERFGFHYVYAALWTRHMCDALEYPRHSHYLFAQRASVGYMHRTASWPRGHRIGPHAPGLAHHAAHRPLRT